MSKYLLSKTVENLLLVSLIADSLSFLV